MLFAKAKQTPTTFNDDGYGWAIVTTTTNGTNSYSFPSTCYPMTTLVQPAVPYQYWMAHQERHYRVTCVYCRCRAVDDEATCLHCGAPLP